eukprot:Protomagalhaensia_wolfi_Nauph_80__2012@NODE_2276_length_1142_cov_90_755213_g1780_i0_p1_GENE_NODE_2276_length_1142_cov_90_755213_g1780_i0NODE_2276_length_1142_cov_90_755213_g1780_i0_p1_ORF_typecomplete_len139_score13_77Chitin_synth_2/PF03142_15/1_4_NODE_2276_length_1142_cov_90_755213_g1780_i0433849
MLVPRLRFCKRMARNRRLFGPRNPLLPFRPRSLHIKGFFFHWIRMQQKSFQANTRIPYFHNERPWKVWLFQESIQLAVAFFVTLVSFGAFIIIPLVVVYPLVMAMKPSSLLLVILFPCTILYGIIIAAITFRKGRQAV